MSGVDVHQAGHVAVVTFSWGPLNYVSTEQLSSLAEALEHLDHEPPVRAVVIQSHGRTFCAGAEPASMREDGGLSQEGQKRGPLKIHPLYVQAARLFATRKPIVVAIDGAAVGAGLGLALAGDFRVASPKAWFSANFVKLGFHPGFGLTHTLPRLVGPQRANDMMLRGARVTAEEALDCGLVDGVTTTESLPVEALARATEIADNAPLAVQRTRATLRSDLVEAVKRQTAVEWREQTRLASTADFREGVRAAMERRPGVFEGH